MSALDPITSNDRLAHLIRELMQLFMHRTSGEMLAIMTEARLSMPQMVTLNMLQCTGSRSISAIANKLGLSLPATSHLVDRMVNQGFVSRSEDTSDRRHKCIVLTTTGQELVERLIQARTREIAQKMDALPPELRDQLEQVLSQVVAQLDRADWPH